MPNLHRALEALTRLPQTPSPAVNELTASVRAVAAERAERDDLRKRLHRMTVLSVVLACALALSIALSLT